MYTNYRLHIHKMTNMAYNIYKIFWSNTSIRTLDAVGATPSRTHPAPFVVPQCRSQIGADDCQLWLCCRVVEVEGRSTCGRQVTEATMMTVTATVMRPVCGPYQSTQLLMTDRLPAMMKVAHPRSPPLLATARVATRTPEWYGSCSFCACACVN